MAFSESIMSALTTLIHGSSTWPPPGYRERWEEIQAYRRRYENSADELFMYRTDLHGKTREAHARRLQGFTPVPLAREVARFSSAMLFSEEPQIKPAEEGPDTDEDLSRLVEENGLAAALYDNGETVASEGVGALRILEDEAVSDYPIITFVPEDRVIWDIRHGRFVAGGVVVIERRDADYQDSTGQRSDVVWRLLEEHGTENRRGYIARSLYRGRVNQLGTPVELADGPEEFQGFEPEVDTGLDRPTLVRWQNVPGGHSDIAGLDRLLDTLDDAETVGRQKMRRSEAITFADRALADSEGDVELDGVILTGQINVNAPLGDTPVKTIETVQPSIQADDHVTYVDHVQQTIISMGGYAIASWGMGESSGADSGRALRLRQARTLLTKAGKDRMATQAISEALGVALALYLNQSEVRPLRPKVTLGDGMPEDRLENAEEAASLAASGSASTERRIRIVNPGWDDEMVEAEKKLIEQEKAAAKPDIEPEDEDDDSGEEGSPRAPRVQAKGR